MKFVKLMYFCIKLCVTVPCAYLQNTGPDLIGIPASSDIC